MKKFLSFLFFVAITVIVNAQGLATGVEMKGDVKDGSLVFTFENRSNKTIANCNFKLTLPEGVSVKPKGKKYMYEEGDATEGMTFSIAFKNSQYTITIYDGEFDETAGNTIISLPLEGELAGQATVSSIAFGDPDGNNISRPEDFKVDLATTPIPTPTGSVELMGEVNDGSLVFTYENTTGKTISNCTFQFTLPEGMALTPNGSTYKYEKGDATAGMTFSIGRSNNQYTVTIKGGKFNETAGNTIITLPLEGTSGGKATVSNIAFGDASGNVLSRPDGFTLNIPSITPPPTPTSDVELKGEVKDGNLVFTFENKSDKIIANCNFTLALPEGVTLIPKKSKFEYKEGDATEGMTFSVKQCAGTTDKWSITVYDGEFDETAGNTIITLPLQGTSGGEATVSNIAFGDRDGNNISRPADFTVNIPSITIIGSVDMKGEVKDGSLVFTFENTTERDIANCNFQFMLPEGISVKRNSTTNKYLYERGDATKGMTFSVSFSNNRYSVAVSGDKFDETAGNTIISLPLEGKTGGEATVHNIMFADTNGNIIGRPESFTVDIPSSTTTGSVELKGEVKDGNLVFSFENTTGQSIANCNFQFVLPEGMSVQYDPINNKYICEEGNATAGMTFYTSFTNNRYTVIVYGDKFNESAGNTIISLPLASGLGGEATVSNIAFSDSIGNNIGKPEDFTIDVPAVSTGSIELTGELRDGSLVFMFENTTGKIIANCNFKLELPEGVSIKKNSTGKKYLYEKGDATEDMVFSIAFTNNKYTVTIYDGEFDESAGNTIISLPLEGTLAGEAKISSAAFGDPNGNNIYRPDDFTIDLTTVITGSVDMQGEVNDGSLVFKFENTTGKAITNCNFQLTLPEGMSVKLNETGKKYKYERGDATEDLAFSIAFNNNLYTVAVSGGEFDETAGNTIITLPLQGKTGGEAIVNNIVFGGSNDNIIGKPSSFAMDIPSTAPTGTVDLKGEVKDGNLVFTFENTSGQSIANCNFKLMLPEGVSVKPKGKKYMYEEGDATMGMTFYIASNNNQYTVAIFGDKFNEAVGNTIITLPLYGRSGGEATVSNIAFGDPDGNNISRPENFTMDVPSPNSGSVDLKGEVKDGSLVFTFENTSGTAVSNCNFQFVLPDGVSVKQNSISEKCIYEEGDATKGLSFYVTSYNNQYTVTIFGGDFDESGNNTIITLPLIGSISGEASVANIAFGDSNGNNISRPNGFTMAIIGVGLDAEIKDDKLVFTYENNSGMTIANCNFQFELPEGMSLTPDEEASATRALNGKSFGFGEGNTMTGITEEVYKYEEGAATAGMNFSIKFDASRNAYSITINDGVVNEAAGNTLVSLPLMGKSGGEAVVSDIAFEDPDNNPISESEGFTVDVNGVDMNGEMKDGKLVFTFENTSGKAIGNCNFQFALPEGLSLSSNGGTYKFEKGDATENMKFQISFSDNIYTVAIFGGEFDELTGNTIISLPLQGRTGGKTTVSNIAFGDTDGNNISRPDDFTMDVNGVGLKGDVDGNGSVGLGDLEAILQIKAGEREETPAADVDGNGSVGLGDIEAILRIMAGGE